MKIEKKNEVYAKITTEPHIARELSEYFTFEVPGAKFMPAYRSKVWDGKYDYSQLLQDKSIWDCYPTLENSVKEMTLNIV